MGTSSVSAKLYRDTLQDSSGETWQEIAELNSASFPDESRETIDFTTLNATNQYRILQSGFRDPGIVQFNINSMQIQYDRLNQDFESNDPVFCKILLNDSAASEFIFEGLITRLGGAIPEGSGKLTCDIEIKLSGELEIEPGDSEYVPTTLGTFFGSYGETGDGEFDLPYSLAEAPDGSIYVADTDNHRIQKFDSDGNFVTKWGSRGSGDGQFEWPYGIDVDSEGNVYVADRNNHRIQKFDSDGNFVTKWGSYGSGDGEFSEPSDVVIDNEDKVYIVDVNNIRIQVFDSGGNYLSKWIVSEDSNTEPYRAAVEISGSDVFIYVVDSYGGIVYKFDSSGSLITSWNDFGPDEDAYLAGIDIDSSGNIYITDATGYAEVIDFDLIRKFNSDGEFVTSWGNTGDGEEQCNTPWAVKVAVDGTVLIADTTNNRIMRIV